MTPPKKPKAAQCHCGRDLKPFGKDKKCPVGHIQSNAQSDEAREFWLQQRMSELKKLSTQRKKPEALEVWAIIDIQDRREPFPLPDRWTYHGAHGKQIGLLAVYEKKPAIPKKWRKFKKAIRVLITPL